MSFKNNAYDLIAEVRKGINEYSTAYVQGTDTSGAFDNADILKKINDAQTFLYNMVIKRDPHSFLTSTTLTGSSSVYALPTDFYRLRRLEDSYGRRIRPIDLDTKRRTNETGSKYRYYLKGSNIIIDYDGMSDSLTLWYYTHLRALTSGVTSAGGALSATLATTARPIVDYYNGIQIENITDAFLDTISDYTAARVATVAGTWAVSKYYGTVPEIPEGIQHLIGPKAILLMKDSHKSLATPSKSEMLNFETLMTEAFTSLYGSLDSDQLISELFI